MPVSKRARWVALAISLYFIGVQIVYASVTLPFESPDEESHFLYIHNLLSEKRLPILEDRATVFASGSAQRHHPPLYYAIGALLIAGTDRSDLADFRIPNPAGSQGVVSPLNSNLYLHPPDRSSTQTARAIWILRLYSIALSAGVLWLVFLIGEIAFPGVRVGLAAMLLTASIPTFAGIGASINNDSLITLTFAAGIYWSLRLWRQRHISVWDALVMGVILAAAALSKLTGLSLFFLSYVALLMGAYKNFYSWQAALKAFIVSLGVALLLAGWWYIRNWQLYGDPLAIDATRAIWQRQLYPQNYADAYFEARGVWMSFWMTLGQFNVIGPIWFYNFLNDAMLIGIGGLFVAAWHYKAARPAILLCLLTVMGIIAALVQATREINISQGRILFPALAAFAPLLALSWRAIMGRWAGLMLLPLALITLLTPLLYLAPAFPPLQTATVVPPTIWQLDARSETMRMLGYEVLTEVVEPGEIMRVRIYFQGRDDTNPMLFVKALDPATRDIVGEVTFFPGMTPTSRLDPSKVYSVEAAFRVYGIISPCSPCRLEFIAGWFSQQTGQNLVMQDSSGGTFESILGFAPIYFDPANPSAPSASAVDIPLGEGVSLRGYSLPDLANPGSEVLLRVEWEFSQPFEQPWVLALGILDAEGALITRADATMLPYQENLWDQSRYLTSFYRVALAADLPPGEYQVYIGRYGTDGTTPLVAEGLVLADSYYRLPTMLQVR